MIEAEVFGDPAAIRAVANEIVGRADVVGAIPARFTASLDAVAFEGPAAGRLRSTSADARVGVAAIAADLRAVASALFSDATAVERMNSEAKAAAEAAAAAQDEAAAGAASGGPDAAKTTVPAADGRLP